jgi:hypothetical protein
MTSVGRQSRVRSARRLSVAEQGRLLGTRPIESADTYARGRVWESEEEEVEKFIRVTRVAPRGEDL